MFSSANRQINVLIALVTLLGLPTLTLLLWLASLVLPSGQRHSGFGELWLWISRRLARSGQTSTLTRALASTLSRARALQPLLATVSHTIWLFALLATTLTVAGLLSARRYTFNWETTLLSSDTFVTLTTWIGWPPSLLGFNTPSASVIRLSDGMHTLPPDAHVQWSGWLIGCLVCYGVVPRALALAASWWTTRKRLARIRLDTSLPGYAELRNRLDPASLPGAIDAPAPAALHANPLPGPIHTAHTNARCIIGIELPDEYPWPPEPVPRHIHDLGVLDTWPQRKQALVELERIAPHKLLVVCDGRQTPDRGTIMLIQQLFGLAQYTHVLLATPATQQPAAPDRNEVWRSTLTDAGINDVHIHDTSGTGLAWLHSNTEPQTPS